MTAFTEEEQWDHNYDVFVVDKYGKLGHLSHVGWRLLPPSIGKSKERWQKTRDFFNKIPNKVDSYKICPDLKIHLDRSSIINMESYLKIYGGMSSKGLFSYDSYDFSFVERPYFRVTIPKNELILDDLPDEIKGILKDLKLNEISFAETSLIPEVIVKEL
ncbi:MAG: hypothetical protein R2747_17135 [Pyrinomonadaceae bacterium]